MFSKRVLCPADATVAGPGVGDEDGAFYNADWQRWIASNWCRRKKEREFGSEGMNWSRQWKDKRTAWYKRFRWDHWYEWTIGYEIFVEKRRNEKPEEETRGIPEESIKLDTTGTSVRVSYLRLISAMWPAKGAVSACVCVSEEKPKQWLEAKLSNKRKLAADLQLATYILLVYALYMKDNEKIHAKIFEVSEFLLIAGSDSPGYRKQGGDRKFHFAFRQWLHAFRVFLTFVTVTEPYCQVHTKADEEKAKEEATFICHLCIQGKQEDLMKQHSFPWNKFIVVYLSGYSSRKRRFVWLVCFACFFCFVCIVCSVCFVCLPGCLPTAGRGRCWEAIGLEPFSGAYAMGQVAKRWTGWLLKAVSARSKVSQIPNTQKLFTLS